MTRQRFDNRRPNERIEFEHAGKLGMVILGFRVEITPAGLFRADRPGEVFVMYGKVGADVEAAARDFGLFLSISMQSGIDLKAFQLSMTRLDDGRAASVIGAAIDAIVETYWSVSGGSDGRNTEVEPDESRAPTQGDRNRDPDAGSRAGDQARGPIPDQAYGHARALAPRGPEEGAAALLSAEGSIAPCASGQGKGV
jgi:hypothetical protein